MRLRIIFALLTVAVGLQAASATEIGLDLVLVANPGIISGDSFDNGSLDSPPWFVISGLPGPEAGTTLAMHHGDFIFQGLTTNPDAATTAFSLMQLTDFPAGSFASMIVFGDAPGELLSLGVLPGFAVLTDGSGTPLGSTALPASSSANLLLTVDPFGAVFASVNDVAVFGGPLGTGPAFGPLTGLGISVVPEPATLGLLDLGRLAMGVRRMRRARN